MVLEQPHCTKSHPHPTGNSPIVFGQISLYQEQLYQVVPSATPLYWEHSIVPQFYCIWFTADGRFYIKRQNLKINVFRLITLKKWWSTKTNFKNCNLRLKLSMSEEAIVRWHIEVYRASLCEFSVS